MENREPHRKHRAAIGGKAGKIGRVMIAAVLVLVTAATPAASSQNGAFLGGWEADSHSNGYAFTALGYTQPVTPGVALTMRVSAGYLYYQFPENGGVTKVTSPTFALLAGPQFSGQRVSLTLTAGAETSTITRENAAATGQTKTTEHQVSAVLNGTFWAQLSQRWDFLYIANYEDANKYTWMRGTTKYRVTEQDRPVSFSVGPEVTAQGNADIKSLQGGGMLEVYFRPASLSLDVRGGYKSSTFPQGPSQTGPYWGAGFYTQF